MPPGHKGTTHGHRTPAHRDCPAPPGPGCDRIGEKLGILKFFCSGHEKILHYCCPPQEDSLLLLSPQAAGHRPAPPGAEGRPDSTETKNTKRGTISYYRVYRRVEEVGQKIKTQKEVRLDTTEHTVGRRGEGWGRRGNTQREVRFDIAEYTGGRRGCARRGKKQKDTTAAATGRRAPPSAAGHRAPPDSGEKFGISKSPCCRHKKILHCCCLQRTDSLLLLSPPAAGHRPAPPDTGCDQIADKIWASRDFLSPHQDSSLLVCHKRVLDYCCRNRPPGTAQCRRAPGAARKGENRASQNSLAVFVNPWLYSSVPGCIRQSLAVFVSMWL